MSIKVFIVDDSAFMRRIVNDILTSDKDIEVIGYARNGKDALEKLKYLKPDVITLDVEMPEMNGIDTLKQIMQLYKIPVIMLSGLTQLGADMTVTALEIGAVDFIPKPKSIFNMDKEEKRLEIINKVKVAVNAKISTRKSISNNYKRNIKTIVNNRGNSDSKKYKNIIAIGSSTGGPRALQSIIPNMPKDMNASMLVVQHMPPEFTNSLAKRLNNISEISVKEAEDGEILKKGYCYIAPGDYHMTIVKKNSTDLYISLNQSDKVSGHRPSVDVMMDSVADINSYNKVAAILTGMGGDGAKGIKKIRENGGHTIAQDQDTCIVFGMPKVAIKNDAIDIVLPLEQIADEIITKVGV